MESSFCRNCSTAWSERSDGNCLLIKATGSKSSASKARSRSGGSAEPEDGWEGWIEVPEGAGGVATGEREAEWDGVGMVLGQELCSRPTDFKGLLKILTILRDTLMDNFVRKKIYFETVSLQFDQFCSGRTTTTCEKLCDTLSSESCGIMRRAEIQRRIRSSCPGDIRRKNFAQENLCSDGNGFEHDLCRGRRFF